MKISSVLHIPLFCTIQTTAYPTKTHCESYSSVDNKLTNRFDTRDALLLSRFHSQQDNSEFPILNEFYHELGDEEVEVVEEEEEQEPSFIPSSPFPEQPPTLIPPSAAPGSSLTEQPAKTINNNPTENPTPEEKETLKEMVEIGKEAGNAIAEEVVRQSLEIIIDGLIASATAALFNTLQNDAAMLPAAMIGFLLKLKIPKDIAEKIAHQVVMIIYQRWTKIADRVKVISKSLAQAFVASVSASFVEQFKSLIEQGRDPSTWTGAWEDEYKSMDDEISSDDDEFTTSSSRFSS